MVRLQGIALRLDSAGRQHRVSHARKCVSSGLTAPKGSEQLRVGALLTITRLIRFLLPQFQVGAPDQRRLDDGPDKPALLIAHELAKWAKRQALIAGDREPVRLEVHELNVVQRRENVSVCPTQARHGHPAAQLPVVNLLNVWLTFVSAAQHDRLP
jgi:hypothetical protein